MRISDWSSDVCSSDLGRAFPQRSSGLCDHLVRARLAQRGRRVHRVSRRTALAAGEEMTADIAPEQPPRRAGRENFRQLIMLRWLAVSGQLAHILNVTLGMGDRKSGVEGKGVAVRLDHGGGRSIKKKNK